MNYSKKLKREAAKVAYKKFCSEWKMHKKNPQYEDDASTPTVNVKTENGTATHTRSPLNNNRRVKQLGRRPTFREWFASVKNVPKFQSSPEEVQEHLDLTWDE